MKWLWSEDILKISPMYSATSAAKAALFSNSNLATISYSLFILFILVLKLVKATDWVPHMVCKTRTGYLRRWIKSKKSCLKVGMFMVWRGATNHSTPFYFCAINMIGINRKKQPLQGSWSSINTSFWSSLWWKSNTCHSRTSWHFPEVFSSVEEEELTFDIDAPHVFFSKRN